MKTLILFYSYGGNTRKIAEMIQQETSSDLEEIKTAFPYEGDYNSVVNQGQREVNSGFMPEILPLKADITTYDQIILGTPVWWYTFAPAMKTFLHENDLSGKTIYPFATNGGWIGHTFADFKKACPNSRVRDGLNVRFDENSLCTTQDEIESWIKTIVVG